MINVFKKIESDLHHIRIGYRDVSSVNLTSLIQLCTMSHDS